MMNVSRFQLTINHEDPEVVRKGLDNFREQVLIDHNAVSSFGYCGRCESNELEFVLNSRKPLSIIGVLKAYLMASPQLEELFVLWSLPGRETDTELSAALMNCMAVILFCSSSDDKLSGIVSSRILHDCFKSVQSQLCSGNTHLIHATLGLLIAMISSTQQNCRDVYQRLTFSDSVFGVLIQKGKMVNWRDVTKANSNTFGTDSRTLIIIIILNFLVSVDESSIAKMLITDSTVRKVTHSINKDSLRVVQLVLNGILYSIAKSDSVRQHINEMADSVFMQKLISLYRSDDDALQNVVHDFVIRFCECLSQPILWGGVSGKRKAVDFDASSITVACIGNILKQLTPQSDDRHKLVILPTIQACGLFLTFGAGAVDGAARSSIFAGEMPKFFGHVVGAAFGQ